MCVLATPLQTRGGVQGLPGGWGRWNRGQASIRTHQRQCVRAMLNTPAPNPTQ